MEVKIYFQHVVSYPSHCPVHRASVVPYDNLLLYQAWAQRPITLLKSR